MRYKTINIILIILFIWELPQNILGAILWLFNRNIIVKTERIHSRYFFEVKSFGISLGSFIFWFKRGENDYSVKKHEYGHSVQSKYLGPLYLLLVGVPSVSRVLYRLLYYKLRKIRWNNYHKGYPEHWADVLGDKYF
jgi:hypothetical protein